MRFRRHGKEEEIRPEACLNCGAALEADHNYCPQCGQDTGTSRIAVGDLLREVWAEFVQIDSKLFRTLIPLLFKPGFLTREYLAGRRARYLSPFKMYLVVAALFFAMASWLGARTVDRTEPPPPPPLARSAPAPAAPGVAPHAPNRAESAHDELTIGRRRLDLAHLPASVGAYERAQAALPQGRRDDPSAHFVIARVIRIRQLWETDKPTLVASIIGYFPDMMFFLLPVYAMLLRVLYARSKWLFVEHLVFALHVHTMFFLVCGLTMLAAIPSVAHVRSPFDLGGLLIDAMWFYFLIYGVVAARRVYEQSLIKTLIKSGFLITTYLTVVTIALVGTVMYALARV